ncbi:ABC transporter ATP-binding protein [Paramagnetospirillum marisnigri]|nr:ABC transporter ATP-binding protein [Paramagnetospirillum marisnigri]
MTMPVPPFLHYRDFNGGHIPRTALAFLARFLLSRFRWRIVALVLGTLGGIGLMTLEPLFLRDLVEALRLGDLSDPWTPAVWTPFGLVAGAWVISATFNRVREIIDIHTSPQLRYEVQTCLFSYLIEHSPEYFHRNFAGRLAQKVKQAGQSTAALLSVAFNEMVRVVAVVVIGFFVVGHDHPQFAAVMLGWTIAFVAAAVMLSRRCLALSREFSNQMSASTGTMVDVIGNADVVLSFARAPHECLQVARAVLGERDASIRLRWFLTLMWAVLYTALVLFQIVMIALAVRETVLGRMVVGETVMVVSLSAILFNNIWGLAARMLEFLEELGVLDSALDSILSPHAIVDAAEARRLEVSEGAIGFEHVSFRHLDGNPVFDDLSFRVRPGEKIGLVGPSGAGKSTLVRLIQRHYQPQSGRIVIDGQDIAAVTRLSLNEAVAEVPQQPGLFHRSIAENIGYARLDAGPEAIRAASTQAHCHGFITRRPEGYDSLVGEHGIQLSGGERQRVAIARALLKDSRILILDEATSALDSETEAHIREALWQLFEGRTVIAIAHRLSTISRMDRILYLEGGRILEEGSHDALLALNGRYASLWRHQAGGFLPET